MIGRSAQILCDWDMKFRGEDVKVGVISDSYDKDPDKGPSNLDIANGDLPAGGVEVLFDGGRIPGASDEGRAMLQIIHDIAPGGRVGLLKPDSSVPVLLPKASQDLADVDCDIIVDDVTYITEPFFKDGLVAQAVENVTAQGVTYISAAGNYGDNSYTGTFDAAPAPPGIPGMGPRLWRWRYLSKHHFRTR